MTLPNGLTVVLSPDHSTPIVHVELWYHVGSKDEKAGRTGFAHLFEHMMFKGSKNVEPEEHASMLASIGGQSNALHERRCDGVLADGAVAVFAAGALDGSRPHGDAADRQGDVRKRARGRQRGTPAPRGQPAVRPAVGNPLRHRVHRQPLQAHDDRQHEGSRRGFGRGRPRLPQHVLRAGKRDDRHRRRFRHGAGQGAGDTVFRPRPEVGSRDPTRLSARSRRGRANAASR